VHMLTKVSVVDDGFSIFVSIITGSDLRVAPLVVKENEGNTVGMARAPLSTLL